MYRKPIVFDEIKYEGNIPLRWGNLSAEEMVHRFWECIIAGTYPGHGECLLASVRRAVVVEGRRAARPEPGADRVPARDPGHGAGRGHRADRQVASTPNVAGKPGEYYLVYFGAKSPLKWKFQLPRHKRDDPQELAGGMQFHVDVLDTWNMTVTPVDKPFTIRQPAEDRLPGVRRGRRTLDRPAGQSVDGAADHAGRRGMSRIPHGAMTQSDRCQVACGIRATTCASLRLRMRETLRSHECCDAIAIVDGRWLRCASRAVHAARADRSPHAVVQPVRLDEVRWTDGFWADRFATVPRAIDSRDVGDHEGDEVQAVSISIF